MNTRLLRRIQKHILEEPKRLDMGDLLYVEDDGPRCDTVGCIAGWAHLLTHKALIDDDELHSISTDDGRKALCITTEQADRLFFTSVWPTRYKDAYAYAKTPRGRAGATSRRIEHFIKTKGKE